MTRSSTRFVDFASLRDKGELGSMCALLMMVGNDLSVSNELMEAFRLDAHPKQKQRAISTGVYAMRLQVGHLFEAFDLIKDIKKSPFLMERVQSCDAHTQAAFARLLEVASSSPQKNPLHNTLMRIRNNISFHYDRKLVARAIAYNAAPPPFIEVQDETVGEQIPANFQQIKRGPILSSMTRSIGHKEWHWQIGLSVTSQILLRVIFDIPEYEDKKIEAKLLSEKYEPIHQLLLDCMDFIGEFAWKHGARYG